MTDTDFLLSEMERMLDAKLAEFRTEMRAMEERLREEMRDVRRELKDDIRASEQRLTARMETQDIRLKDTEARLTDHIEGRIHVVLSSTAETQAQRYGSIRDLQRVTNRHDADISDIRYRLIGIEAKLKE
jgi:hypothetical protein